MTTPTISTSVANFSSSLASYKAWTRFFGVLGLACACTLSAAQPHGSHAHAVSPAASPVASTSAPVAQAVGISVNNAWVRATVAGQQVSGVFMQLHATQKATLVGVESASARQSEIHEMRMEGDVMRMRPVESLELPAGQTVELRPGGYHIMLMGLYEPLEEGRTIGVTLRIQSADGQRHAMAVQVPVRGLLSGSPNAHGKSGGHGSQTGH